MKGAENRLDAKAVKHVVFSSRDPQNTAKHCNICKPFYVQVRALWTITYILVKEIFVKRLL
jgi:hypothetical protein